MGCLSSLSCFYVLYNITAQCEIDLRQHTHKIPDNQKLWTAVPTTFQIFITGSSWDKMLPNWTEALRFDWLRLSAQGQVFENSMLSELGWVNRANLLCKVKPLGSHYSLQIGVACHAFSLFILSASFQIMYICVFSFATMHVGHWKWLAIFQNFTKNLVIGKIVDLHVYSTHRYIAFS